MATAPRTQRTRDSRYNRWSWNEEGLEDRIRGIYQDEADALYEIADGYFSTYSNEQQERLAMVADGRMSEAAYRNWMLNTVTRGERYQEMAEEMAARASAAHELTSEYIYDYQVSAYANGHNHMAYSMDYGMEDGRTVFDRAFDYSGSVDFTLMDESTVRRLLVDMPQTMPSFSKAGIPRYQIQDAQNLITSCVTSGIIRGESVGAIANNISTMLSSQDRTRSLRAARTALTSAQNGGRQDMLDYAVEILGIEAKKMWISTRDGRTRDSHVQLNGVIVPYNKKFPNGLMFPGDMANGTAAELYNCRCTVGYVMPETKKDFTGKGKYSTGNTAASYKKWQQDQADKKTQRAVDLAKKAQEEKYGKTEKSGIKDTVLDAPEARSLDALAKSDGIEYREPEKLSRPLTDREIIEKICGGDLTGGSCSSAAFAFAANKAGYSVNDFRGGDSEHMFARPRNITKIMQAVGGYSTHDSPTSLSDLELGEMLLGRMEQGKQYYLALKGHAAVCGLDDLGRPYYIELQAGTGGYGRGYGNGVHLFEDEVVGGESAFEWRFGCGKRTYGGYAAMIDLDTLTSSDDFLYLTGYINTEPGREQKGAAGTIK